MKITGLALLSDNYAWLLVDEGTGECAVIDPSEAAPVMRAVEEEGWRLRWILNTHHHWDHTGGNEELIAATAGIEVICSEHDGPRIAGASRLVGDGDRVTVAGGEAVCLAVPGHTLGAVAFHFPAHGAVFTGDTLFLAGCGRLFEGTPEQMHASLVRLAALPVETAIYCGHEYTEKNLRFAAETLPEDEKIRARLDDVAAQRARGEATVPAPLSVELATNPFLRAGDAAVGRAVGESRPVDVFAALRRRRDAF